MPGKRIPRNKRDMKSLAASPPRKDPIPNQDMNMLITVKYQSLPPQLPKFRPRYKSLRNKADDDCHYSTDTSRTDKEDFIKNLKVTDNKNSNDKYK